MSFYVYLIQSKKDSSYYKGYMENYNQRLKEHNAGLSNYTSKKIPWDLVYVEECTSRPEALKREKNLKKESKARIEALIIARVISLLVSDRN